MILTGREKRFLAVIALAILFFSITESILTGYRISLAKSLEEETERETLAIGQRQGLSKDIESGKVDDEPKGEVTKEQKDSDALLSQSAESKSKTEDEKPLLNINTADYNQLLEIPGIGPVLAERILTYRLEKGRFLSLDELMEVRGIGEKLLLKIKPYLTI